MGANKNKNSKNSSNCKKEKKVIPCDVDKNECDPCNSQFQVTPLPDSNGIAAAGFVGTAGVVAPGGLVQFPIPGTNFGYHGISSVGNGVFFISKGGLLQVGALVPTDVAGGTLGMAIGASPLQLQPIAASFVHNSGNFGTIQRAGVYEIPDGSYVGIMNVGAAPVTVTAAAPDGTPLTSALQFTRLASQPRQQQVQPYYGNCCRQ
jgi:hypothetical protein